MKKYSKLNNMRYFIKEIYTFAPYGFWISLLVVPARVFKSLVTIYIPKIVIDAIQNNNSENSFMITVLIITVMIMIASMVELFSQNSMVHNMNSFVLIHLNKLWLKKVMNMEYEVFISEEGKQATDKARMSMEGTTRWGIGTYVPRLLNLVTSILGFITYGTILLRIHPLVVIVLLICYLIGMLYTSYSEKKKQLLKDDVAKADRKLNYFAYNTRGMQIAKDIRVFSMREWIKEMATYARQEKKKVDEETANFQKRVGILNSILVFLRDGISYVLLIGLVIKGAISIGEFAFYTAAIIGIGDWLVQITKGIGEFYEANNYVTDFRCFLELPDNIYKTNIETNIKLSSPVEIELKNVTFKYSGYEKNVLDDVSIKIKAGEKIAIVGENGAGKTTMVKLICGLLHPSSGDILINGININEIDRSELFRLFAAVFQDSTLLPVSIKENIIMNNEESDEELFRIVIESTGLDKKINSLTNKEQTPLIKYITENGTDLSGGEKQKLLFARALYRNSAVLILDEPTAALDPIAEQEIYMKYNKYTKNRTSFFISHRLSSTRFCDRILFIKDAVIKEMGTHDELMKKNGEYAEMYNIQSKFYKEEIIAGDL